MFRWPMVATERNLTMSEIETVVATTESPKATRKPTKAKPQVSTNGHATTGLDPRLKMGQVIRREYKGKTHEVKVTKDGFLCKGKVHTSLSKLAKEITGATAINGFAFFKVDGKAPTTRIRKDGLRTGQLRLLKVLVKMNAPISRNVLSEKAGYANPGIIGPVLGVADPILRKKETYPSLLTLDFVKQSQLGGPGEEINELVYRITGKGKQALAKAE